MAIFPQGLTNIDQRCNPGERRVLHQLKRCLEDDYLVWHDVPIGPRARQPDFVILSPRWGLLLLEVKDWRFSTLVGGTPYGVELATDRGRVTEANPIRRARDYAMELIDVLQQDAALVHTDGPWKGRLLFPYGWGAVFSNIRGVQIAGTDFDSFFPASKTLLRDDLDDTVSVEDFQKRLWGMFTLTFPHTLSLPQRDRIRWHLFPEVRMQTRQASLLEDGVAAPALSLPDLMQVMDLQQEQVARTLGEGHRVIHGAAGSGKTMILIFRAQQLAAAARPDQPILVLCYNRALADRIDAMLRQRAVDERVVVRTFHSWCQDMVRTYPLSVPASPRNQDAYYAALAATVNRAVDTGVVPGGQYTALLIDEAHDFEDAWLQMAARLVTPASNSLLVLYDDAQSIYQKKRCKFNFASVGIQALGRTSILRLNYRNTAEVLALAMHCAQSLLTEKPETPDGALTVHPATAGRRGPLPLLIQAPTPAQEAQSLADHIAQAMADGLAPGEVAVLARARYLLGPLTQALRHRNIPVQSMAIDAVRDFDWRKPSVKLLTLHSSKGLEFPLVCVLGLQALPFKDEPMDEEARLLYVGMTRATQRLVLSCAGNSPMVERVKNSLEAVIAQFAKAG